MENKGKTIEEMIKSGIVQLTILEGKTPLKLVKNLIHLE